MTMLARCSFHGLKFQLTFVWRAEHVFQFTKRLESIFSALKVCTEQSHPPEIPQRQRRPFFSSGGGCSSSTGLLIGAQTGVLCCRFFIGKAQSKKSSMRQREAKVRHERRLEHTEEQLGHPGEKFAKARIWSKTLCVDVANCRSLRRDRQHPAEHMFVLPCLRGKEQRCSLSSTRQRRMFFDDNA